MFPKYKIEVYDHHEDCRTCYYAEKESELFEKLGFIMWNEDNEILFVYSYEMDENRVKRGFLKWDMSKSRFYIEWETVWQA
ncbi:hypothetical protein [Lihuaxuella thermophila]|uniref:Uncharacterized protein n=1 Tax=Lihuaxuella thermophila TaxID=1173111 RepID=A0A1H8JQX8_9BACL|nr:hypothetical protein [Lihuaxuella thermophila]SEN82905.1 hypothetical protein SAMN05444955_1374 [Lihuaxuella thermophila]